MTKKRSYIVMCGDREFSPPTSKKKAHKIVHGAKFGKFALASSRGIHIERIEPQPSPRVAEIGWIGG